MCTDGDPLLIFLSTLSLLTFTTHSTSVGHLLHYIVWLVTFFFYTVLANYKSILTMYRALDQVVYNVLSVITFSCTGLNGHFWTVVASLSFSILKQAGEIYASTQLEALFPKTYCIVNTLMMSTYSWLLLIQLYIYKLAVRF